MKKRRTILIILGVVAAALITAIVVLACTAQIYDPNKQLKKHAVEITAGEEKNDAGLRLRRQRGNHYG